MLRNKASIGRLWPHCLLMLFHKTKILGLVIAEVGRDEDNWANSESSATKMLTQTCSGNEAWILSSQDRVVSLPS